MPALSGLKRHQLITVLLLFHFEFKVHIFSNAACILFGLKSIKPEIKNTIVRPSSSQYICMILLVATISSNREDPNFKFPVLLRSCPTGTRLEVTIPFLVWYCNLPDLKFLLLRIEFQ